MTIQRTSYDAVIIGAGPAGATAALLLAKAGWSVAVIERVRYPRRKVCGEFLSATNMPQLRKLGILRAVLDLAGPEVRTVGVFAGDCILTADMPRAADGAEGWGRALGREHLDTLLLDRARDAGAAVWQPWTVVNVAKDTEGFRCTVSARDGCHTLRSRVMIAAHGSWDTGSLPSQLPRAVSRPGDLFGFKAHFRGSRLPSGLMPLVCFPGGYGGMVETGGERVSLSCCVRRDRLEHIRRNGSSLGAGAAVLAHIETSCRGVRQALDGAALDGTWLSAGPIRPGLRARSHDGIFLIGNAAGEAHPVVAEGISMAMQSAWLLSERLLTRQGDILRGRGTESLAEDYARIWRDSFSARLHAAAVIAHLAMRPSAVALVLPMLRMCPSILTWGAARSGKVMQVVAGPCRETLA